MNPPSGASCAGRPAQTLPSSSMTCCLIENNNRRCMRSASSHSFSKRMAKIVEQKKLKLQPDALARHNSICTHHRRMLISQAAKTRDRKDNGRDSGSDDELASIGDTSNGKGGNSNKVKLHALSASTLRRYKKHFKLATKPGANKQQLVDTVLEHFQTLPVNEKETLTYFIYTVKTGRNRLDQMKSASID
uniref:Histone deacetylase complex subunit SAP30 Sin3 binding domain-containing protein n=1 Tax=Plectus sambesii TaxID=2011161 RepID=A0A914WHI5_9BILA